MTVAIRFDDLYYVKTSPSSVGVDCGVVYGTAREVSIPRVGTEDVDDAWDAVFLQHPKKAAALEALLKAQVAAGQSKPLDIATL